MAFRFNIVALWLVVRFVLPTVSRRADKSKYLSSVEFGILITEVSHIIRKALMMTSS